MKTIAFAATALMLSAIAGSAMAVVPPDIAAKLQKIGHVVDVPNTVKLYAPFFKNMKQEMAGMSIMRDLAYGSDPKQKLDVFAAKNAGPKKLVLVYVHGGGFERGDKTRPGIPFYDNIMVWAVKNGYVGVNIDYRIAPKNHWPDAQEDMASVVRWIKANISQYGGDPSRIVLWGESAGASLIAGYLSHPQFWGAQGHGVLAAVMNSGFYVNGPEGSEYFGHDPKELAERSDLEGMKKLSIPLLISHTTIDLPDAVPQAEQANKALCSVGKCPTYVVFENHSHISQDYSVGTPDDTVSAPVLAFIKKADKH
jgi:dipeptidyl aminopeptidase/acylaminoacyl peptidase